ncbi:MAG: phage major capsid protein [Desulfobacteraceae bacterium]|nr:MAG: phage major capsid protein [Desulfobacteraceae bacterium]
MPEPKGKTEVMEITEEKLEGMMKDSAQKALEAVIPELKNELKNELKEKIQIETDEVKKEESIQEVKDFLIALEKGDKSFLEKFEAKAVDSTSSSFGYTIPTELASRILEEKDKIPKMRKNAFVFQHAGPFQLPKEGTGVTSYWVGENTLITASEPTIDKEDLADYYLATRVLMPRQLLRTSAYNVTEFIARLCSRSLIGTEETAFTAGDGSSKPLGLRQTVGITDVPQVGTDLAYDDLINLIYSIAEQYRDNCIFILSTAAIKLLMKLKDNNGLPIFDPSNKRLMGYPYFESVDIPSNLGVGTDETEIHFFDPFYYWIKDSENMFMEVDKIISYLQTELVIAEATDGAYILPEAAAKLSAVK